MTTDLRGKVLVTDLPDLVNFVSWINLLAIFCFFFFALGMELVVVRVVARVHRIPETMALKGR